LKFLNKKPIERRGATDKTKPLRYHFDKTLKPVEGILKKVFHKMLSKSVYRKRMLQCFEMKQSICQHLVSAELERSKVIHYLTGHNIVARSQNPQHSAPIDPEEYYFNDYITNAPTGLPPQNQSNLLEIIKNTPGTFSPSRMFSYHN
jgi:hypothetical protein